MGNPRLLLGLDLAGVELGAVRLSACVIDLMRFDRDDKAWMTVSGGGDDEAVEWPEPICELEEVP